MAGKTYTHITVAFTVPTGSFARVGDAVNAVQSAAQEYKGENFHVSTAMPFSPAASKSTSGKAENGGQPEDGSEGGPGVGNGNAGTGNGKRGPGRPRGTGKRKQAEASGSAAEGGRGEDDGEAGSDAEAAEAGGRSVARGTRKGNREGDEGDRASVGGERGATAPDRRISSGADDRGEAEDATGADDGDEPDWGAGGGNDDKEFEDDPELVAARSKSAWPDDLMPALGDDITREIVSDAMTAHFRANGKDRHLTFKLMEDATGADDLSKIDTEDYDKFLRDILKDTAKYRHGVKKPKA